MHRCIAVVLLLLVLPVHGSDQKYITWLAGLENQGITLDSVDWHALTTNPSQSELNKLIHKYAGFLVQGRLEKRLYQPGWMIEDSDRVLSGSADFSLQQLKQLEPDLPQYQLLVASLKTMHRWRQNVLDDFPDNLIFFEEDRSPVVEKLNRWLMDLDLVDQLSGNEYTQLHKDILTQVQLQFDLMPDGRLGVQTRQALLAITNHRIRILKANLERLRWLPNQLPYPHIRVDIAGLNVAWVKQVGKETLYKAIVGKPDRQTPIFKAEVESITYHPVWKVPHSIAARSMLRAEKKQPGFFRKEGFVVYKNWDDNAPVVNPESVRWSTLSTGSFRYRLEQQPGELNRLGQFKLDLPNPFGVYLHDTDKPDLFDRQQRTFSSGCTRVKGIGQLIHQILASQDNFEDQHKPGKSTFKRVLDEKVPVYFLYFTAWPDNSGRVRFREDIYQLDKALVSWF